MRNVALWSLAFLITIGAAYYQRKTGPTNPMNINVTVNDSTYKLSLKRSLSLDERSEIRLKICDTSINARLFYKRLNTSDNFETSNFSYKEYPVTSFFMNKVFGITEEKGFYAEVPQQPAAGKLEYYIEITDSTGTNTLLKENPVVIRFKGGVPGFILIPHILIMFIVMFFSTLAGLMSITKNPAYKKYTVWTMILIIAGGMILGPLVQKYAFGEFWTGVPFGWDLTDNKTLISLIFWILAVIMNIKKDRPLYTLLASAVLLIVYSIPHSLFGSSLDYETGKVTQGFILFLIIKYSKKS